MKTTRLALTTTLLWMATFGEALAVETNKVYSSGIFVIGFIAFWALILVAQMIPAFKAFWGLLKGSAKQAKESAKVELQR